MQSNSITFEILVKNKPITEYHKDGKIFLEGRQGSEYQLKIYNSTINRILAIPSIDGLSVLDGKPANYNSKGYIVPAWGSIIIEGWRTDLNNVRKFEFSSRSSSYSQKSGQGQDNIGVIGLACFKEKTAIRSIPLISDYNLSEYERRIGSMVKGIGATASVSYTSNSIAMNSLQPTNLGTGMGEKIESRVTEVVFKREDNPFVRLEAYYYERKQLERMGIVDKVIKNTPNAFPAQFCKEV